MGVGHVFLVGIVCAAVAAASWFLAPKKNLTLYRSSALLTIACCYIMWMCTYLCQLNPLIYPKRADLRVEHKEV
ncbi:hypothetical protein CcaverHIS002_0602880 [Cutaneotrichosporon cavernicola]|uniref:Uncharacterized protein n=1 Tax=Cutaneotrichosporon cavernicola TaxID=279322 RepID=A0AA48L886_9TREE|nr:uncharacterized protein CcaverHIS019_0602360 [Cutaneotrichosporon cavernicola]BEI86001.1 hypothetical protein CcaverHIS002_0602880 [Cutaneotrichosporon cavernicola]BEI93777.1 hypothetical protein CcaverHIS019_0602360 [Cutaneotrichosporon cavernicola]BEJ01555.1 hypothetical protein CcaverHIS631_0602370 [Cutaneotrichosporon cavernicola]BEJ09320.1 hypothetical protein CcaverHIS641_0602350 [Cutaneotrichosporon cavernicola]